MSRRFRSANREGRLTRYLVGKFLSSARLEGKLRSALSARDAQALNRRVMKLSLRAAGYNPVDNSDGSGEGVLARMLADLGLTSALDIGANLGSYSEGLLRAGFQTVFAVEPLPQCESSLEALRANYNSRFSYRSVAVGQHPGSLPIFFDPQSLVLASLSADAEKVPYVNYSESLAVPVTTVDLLWRETGLEWDFVKIDTEGFEAEVLKGSVDFLRSRPPKVIQVEVNHHHLFRGHSLLHLCGLLPGGYQAYRLLPGDNGPTKVDPSSAYSNFFFFSNFLFVRADFVQSFDLAIEGA